jgi:polyisoprenoid-binding protein YceI
MHGATKEVTLNTIFNGVTVGMDEVEVMSFEIAGSLNRGDFGLVWNTPIKTGGLTLSDEVKIEINAEFKKS